MKHSEIGASSMHRWANCPGSVNLSRGISHPPSVHALEGTVAHDLAAEMLAWNLFEIKFPAKDEYNEDMYEASGLYTRTIMQDVHDLEIKPVLNKNVWIEKTFDLSEVVEGAFGTADAVVYSERDKKLIVYDFKYGQGVAVSPVNNLQLLYYGLGVLLSQDFKCKTIELVIVQPRCPSEDGPVRRWETSSVDIIEFSDLLKTKAAMTKQPNAPLTPGDWCRFCPAAGICPALHEKALEIASQEFIPTDNPQENSIDLNRLSQVLEWLPKLEAFTKSVREFAYNQAAQGKKIPGYKLVKKRATRKWDLPQAEIVKKLSEYADKEELFDYKLKSPAQVEKVLGKPHKSIVNDLVIKESSGTTLVSESDRRAEVSVGPEADFNKITTKEKKQ